MGIRQPSFKTQLAKLKMKPTHKIAVVIPSYKVARHILGVIEGIGAEVSHIYIIDDACPERVGNLVLERCRDPRVRVIFHLKNQGVGGAVMTGYRAAIEDGADVIVKVDGDGQMDPSLISGLIAPIVAGDADYAKGNRFFDLEAVRAMPRVRLLGNAVLSFMTKLSSGYWDLFDPTNGYTAIHSNVASHLPFDKISHRYFFETDMLFRLNTLRAVVVDIPMDAKYDDETSSLNISKIIGEFVVKHVRNFFKRILYNYYLRDMSLASIELPIGVLCLIFSIGFGGWHWLHSAREGIITPLGTVMLAALPAMMGLQLVLSFLSYDIASVPRRPRQRDLFTRRNFPDSNINI